MYLPMRDTYMDILRDIRNRYLASGWIDESSFNKKHIAYLIQWAEKWHIRATPEAKKYEAELLGMQNWSRAYWH